MTREGSARGGNGPSQTKALLAVHEAITTAHVVDACMRLKKHYRLAPAGIRSVTELDATIIGPALPVRHFGSVDVFLEALARAGRSATGSIMVIDNAGRTDEACIGDLVVLEAQLSGLAGMAVWGLHRDTHEIRELGLPVFSYGAFPSGPARLDAQEPDAFEAACFGDFRVTASDTVIADADGVVFVSTADWPGIAEAAQAIRERELAQTALALSGMTLREQFQFEQYLARRAFESDYTFRRHLAELSRSIEE
ncbi:MAG: RraA family protein [Candidatus Melainabacteria bacterium]